MNRSDNPKILIPYIGEPLSGEARIPVEKIKQLGASAAIDKINWPEYSYVPHTMVYAGYSGLYLWLYYEVKNDFFRMEAMADQEAVWEDPCVEFFLSTEMDKYRNNDSEEDIVYRNFELNATGICLSANGTMSHREMLPLELMERILRFPGIGGENFPAEGTPFDWELTVAIPLDLIGLSPGSSFKANFQKCGDLTTHPHYVTWSPIESAEPEFHLPLFFGDAELVR